MYSELSRFLYYFGNMQEGTQVNELSRMLQPRMVCLALCVWVCLLVPF